MRVGTLPAPVPPPERPQGAGQALRVIGVGCRYSLPGPSELREREPSVQDQLWACSLVLGQAAGLTRWASGYRWWCE